MSSPSTPVISHWPHPLLVVPHLTTKSRRHNVERRRVHSVHKRTVSRGCFRATERAWKTHLPPMHLIFFFVLENFHFFDIEKSRAATLLYESTCAVRYFLVQVTNRIIQRKSIYNCCYTYV